MARSQSQLRRERDAASRRARTAAYLKYNPGPRPRETQPQKAEPQPEVATPTQSEGDAQAKSQSPVDTGAQLWEQVQLLLEPTLGTSFAIDDPEGKVESVYIPWWSERQPLLYENHPAVLLNCHFSVLTAKQSPVGRDTADYHAAYIGLVKSRLGHYTLQVGVTAVSDSYTPSADEIKSCPTTKYFEQPSDAIRYFFELALDHAVLGPYGGPLVQGRKPKPDVPQPQPESHHLQ